MLAQYVPSSQCILSADEESKKLSFSGERLYIITDYDGCFGAIGNLQQEFIKATTHGRYAHVLWSKPLLEGRWNIPHQTDYTRIHALLSLALLRAHGQQVVLYTDDAGTEVLGDLPYDIIYNILDSTPVDTNFWAAGKIISLDNEPLDSCLIDTDMFVFDGAIIDAINRGTVLCSHRERTLKYDDIIEDFCRLAEMPKQNFSTNTGVMKMADPVRKQAYVRSYFKAVKVISKNLELWRYFNKDARKMFWTQQFLKEVKPEATEAQRLALAADIQERYPERNGIYCADLIAEQYIYSLAQPQPLFDEEICHNGNMASLGFCHLISMDKFFRIKDVIDRLSEFPERDLLKLEIDGPAPEFTKSAQPKYWMQPK